MSVRKTRKLVVLTPELAARIDEYRWGNRIGSESEALRRLVELGLDAEERRRDGAGASP